PALSGRSQMPATRFSSRVPACRMRPPEPAWGGSGVGRSEDPQTDAWSPVDCGERVAKPTPVFITRSRERSMRFNRKLWPASAAGPVALGSPAGAYAYWTTSGSGDATAGVASTNGTVTLHATIADGIVPGGAKPVTFTADNPGATDLRVGTISL